jgi:GTPase
VAHRAGTVAIVGRPNVGKSTLLNSLVGSKVAIVSPRPQTTRNRLLGIRTLPEAQAVFVDTPGIHQARSLLNRRMVDVARQALGDADAAVLVLDVEAGLGPGDRALITTLAASRRPTVVVLNKLDRVRPPALLPMMAELGTSLPGREVIPASAQTGDNVPAVLAAVLAVLPEGPCLYPEDEYTTETERFLAQELVREQLFRQIGQEVPYGTTVVVDAFRDAPERDMVVIQATILVDREGHKGIVIGTGGSRLREVGTRARLELEALLGRKVFLELFVRTEPGWARNPRRLEELGL